MKTAQNTSSKPSWHGAGSNLQRFVIYWFSLASVVGVTEKNGVFPLGRKTHDASQVAEKQPSSCSSRGVSWTQCYLVLLKITRQISSDMPLGM
jgi:hypothetical protein